MRKILAALAAAVIVATGATAAAAAAGTAKPPRPTAADRPTAGVDAPKGHPGQRPDARSRALLAGPYYFYGAAAQTLAAGQSATSLAANLHIENTQLDTVNDAHTLGEIAVRSHDGMQTVEVGTTVDPAVCGAGNSPCLFVFWWKNGVPQCYNGCGWVDYAPTVRNAGASLAVHVGLQKRFQITYSGGAWWVAYDGQWIGYYPATEWSNAVPSGPGVTFTSGGLFQGFYEVATKAAGDATPCTDMANGLLASNGSAGRVGSISMTGTAPGAIVNNFPAYTQNVPVSPVVYSAATVSATTVRAGGPGWNAAGTAAGTIGGC
jgi:hypothetical protein